MVPTDEELEREAAAEDEAARALQLEEKRAQRKLEQAQRVASARAAVSLDHDELSTGMARALRMKAMGATVPEVTPNLTGHAEPPGGARLRLPSLRRDDEAAELARAFTQAARRGLSPTAEQRLRSLKQSAREVSKAAARRLERPTRAAPPTSATVAAAKASAQLMGNPRNRELPLTAPSGPPALRVGDDPGAELAEAFRDGGARAAAARLRALTDGVPAARALSVLEAAQATLDDVSVELGQLAEGADGAQFNEAGAPPALKGDSDPRGGFDTIVAHLTAAAEAAGPRGVDLMADALVRTIDPKRIGRFDEALGNTVATGAGAGLAVAIAARAAELGRRAQASLILRCVVSGAAFFNSRVDELAERVLADDARLAKLVEDWGPLMDEKGLAAASKQFKRGCSSYPLWAVLGAAARHIGTALGQLPESLSALDQAPRVEDAAARLLQVSQRIA
jgi:hypothetical protein